jgi:Na+/proline symporter
MKTTARRSLGGSTYASTIAASDTTAMLTNTRAGRLNGIILAALRA